MRSFLFRNFLPELQVMVCYTDCMTDVLIKPHPRAKRMTLRFDGALGRAILTVPQNYKSRDVVTFLTQSKPWLDRQRAALDRLSLKNDQIMVEGALYSLKIEHNPSGQVILNQSEKTITVHSSASLTPLTLRHFFKKKAREQGNLKCRLFADKLGVLDLLHTVDVKDYKSRWGCCYHKRGDIFLSWRLIMAPPVVFDYICAHEVAHLKEQSHNAHFWALVSDLFPDYQIARYWLKKNGKMMFHAPV